ncbi:MAG: DUF1801 domain-containing protein [Chloroflexi bacterium]|nr:DUF1801 domain-containing protein [Chloroflexota bacterium]MDA1239760.1 DUF1801 domain-containing protein [Chloroflexota bacterium]MQC47670.1 DUF1801 domain-containing protein [Chloroflexota bacterium]
MGKMRQATTTQKPPVALESHADIDDWMQRVMPNLQPIVQHFDALIRETIPDLQYAIKWKKVYYGLPERGWIIEMVAYDVSVNLVFHGGAEFESPPPLGDTGRSRYVKVTTLDGARASEVRECVRQAARVPGWQ